MAPISGIGGTQKVSPTWASVPAVEVSQASASYILFRAAMSPWSFGSTTPSQVAISRSAKSK